MGALFLQLSSTGTRIPAKSTPLLLALLVSKQEKYM